MVHTKAEHLHGAAGANHHVGKLVAHLARLIATIVNITET